MLQRLEQPLELNGAGEIVELAPEEFRPLLEAPVPLGTDEDAIVSRMDATKDGFRSRSTTLADRRAAIRELADVLEALRPEIKEELLTNDERALFQLANGFAIRHNDRAQRRQYDNVIWLRWAFYVYLATIHAVLRVRHRQRNETPTA